MSDRSQCCGDLPSTIRCPLSKLSPTKYGYAEQYNFVLVLPAGISKSFNAKYCCGKARDRKIDDLGYFKAIKQDLVDIAQSSTSSTTPGESSGTAVKFSINPNAFYAVGFSNGAYMVTYAAVNIPLSTEGQPFFRAIAPISGYQVDLPTKALEIVASTEQVGIGLFLHHSKTDPAVRISGCCSSTTMPQCCCRISEYSDSNECVSAQSFTHRWSQLYNGCTSTTTTQSGNTKSVWEHAKNGETNISSTCTTYTNTNTNHQSPNYVNITGCIYEDGKHLGPPISQQKLGIPQIIIDYFANDACKTRFHFTTATGIGMGVDHSSRVWNSETKTCTCQTHSTTTESSSVSSGYMVFIVLH